MEEDSLDYRVEKHRDDIPEEFNVQIYFKAWNKIYSKLAKHPNIEYNELDKFIKITERSIKNISTNYNESNLYQIWGIIFGGLLGSFISYSFSLYDGDSVHLHVINLFTSMGVGMFLGNYLDSKKDESKRTQQLNQLKNELQDLKSDKSEFSSYQLPHLCSRLEH